MGRATKEEAHGWYDRLERASTGYWEAHGVDVVELRAWLRQVAAALPSAAAVQRDRERRRAVTEQTCSVCGEELTRPGGFCACLP